MLTQDRLKGLLKYDPLTGAFIWAVDRGRKAKVGNPAGHIGSNRYCKIIIDGKSYRAHRLAWLYMHGYYPKNEIDHIDNNKLNNKVLNLREVSRSCNMRNRRAPSNNTSGVKGVSFNKGLGKWSSYIQVDCRRKSLGCYVTLDDAVCARLFAEQCLGWEKCDRNSSAYLYMKGGLDA